MKNTPNLYNLQALKQMQLDGKKIGLLGGSFNPPHAGHLAISQRALELGLDYVLWLVVPQNPLKPPYESSLEKRAELASILASKEPHIVISTLEEEIKTTNSYDTIRYLTSHFPKTYFIWIMGVDCLKEFHLWENYDKFPELVDIMIFNRKGYEDLLNNSIAGKILIPELNNTRSEEHSLSFIGERQGDEVGLITGNGIKAKTCKKYKSSVVFVEEKLSDLSSTEIRKKEKI